MSQIQLANARLVAEEFIDRIKDVCVRAEIAGSIRRGKPNVKDIEVVATPIINKVMEKTAFGFEVESGKEINLLDERIKSLAARGFIEFDRKSKNQNKVPSGPRYYRISYHYQARGETYPVDLFVVLPDAQDWGVIFTIRTGSAEFSHQLATLALSKGMKLMGGRLWKKPLPEAEADHLKPLWFHVRCDTEQQFSDALGINYIEPKDRQPTFCKFTRKSGEVTWKCEKLVALTPVSEQFCDQHKVPMAVSVGASFTWACACGSEFTNSKDAIIHRKDCIEYKEAHRDT